MDDAERVRRIVRRELLSANCEEERAVLRCALNLLRGVQDFEIDPVSGLARTVAGFERNAARWAEEYAWHGRDESADTNPYRHDLAMKAREVQARFASVHPHLAEPVCFPDHGPQSCVFCLMNANRAAGLPIDAGVNPVTGGVAKPKQVLPMAVMLPGLEDAL